MTGSILLFLTFVGTLYLESHLKKAFVVPELLLLCVGVFFAFLIVAGEAVRSRWVWKLSTLYYAIAMGNLAFLFVVTDRFLAFAGTLFFALIAFIRAVSHLGWKSEETDKENLQTYAVDGVPITPDTVDPIIVQTTDTFSRQLSKTTTRKKTRRKARKTKKRRKTRR